ncbi:phospholipase patatin family protein [Pyrenophora tritici-repentis]|nr:phospholipase patatin family protein [Pyrenophora tritici-repentis]
MLRTEKSLTDLSIRGAEGPNCQPVSGHSVSLHIGTHLTRFVCVTAKETAGITRLRSYTLPDEGEIPATICQAALATSAATVFFDTVSIGARQFVDGALSANNPVDEVEGEAGNIWSSDTGDLKPLVKCFVSIGTGHPDKKALEDNIETERKFIARWAKHYDEKRYFRFNADQGLQEVGLAEYEEQGRMEAATGEYLQHQAQKLRVRDCIKNLQQKQSVYLDDFA